MRRKNGGALPPEDDPASIGNVLIDLKFITPTELKAAIRTKAIEDDLLLGQILLRETRLTRAELSKAMARQARMRNGIKKDDISRSLCEACKSNTRLNQNLVKFDHMLQGINSKGKA